MDEKPTEIPAKKKRDNAVDEESLDAMIGGSELTTAEIEEGVRRRNNLGLFTLNIGTVE